VILKQTEHVTPFTLFTKHLQSVDH